MKKALKVITLFMLTVMVFLFSGCPEPASVNNDDGEDLDLGGNIRIIPNPATTGTELTVVYDGIENVTYQWQKDSTEVGENSNKFTPNEAGTYTVTVSSNGYQSQTCSVAVSNDGEGLDLSGTISISPTSAETGTRLTATYSGKEPVTYQWKRNGMNIGANSKFFTADTAGTYTVTVSGFGYNPKTSNAVGIYRSNGAIPIITSNYTADPSAHAFDGRLYLYPSRDISPVTGFDYSRMDRYHVYSTDNMVDWIDHGEILRRDDLPESATVGSANDGAWGPHYTDAMFMWGPDAAYNSNAGSGPYFFYFPHALGDKNSWEDTWTIGVAQSDKPYVGFRDSEVVRLKDNKGNYIFGDSSLGAPCVFHDGGDDYYFMVGGDGKFSIAKLKPNMIELDEPLTLYADMSELPHFNEGPWMFRRETQYYLMYSGNPHGGNGDELLYAIGSSPQGPWEYKGSILDPAGTGDTSHGSIVEFSGKWYLFYHNARLSNSNGALRSVCVSELSFNADGSIQKVIQTTTGVAQNGPNLNTNSLNNQFGTGEWMLERKYDELSSSLVGFTLNKTYLAMDSSVVVGGGATKQNNDFPAGAIHNLHISGSYVDFTQIPSYGKAFIRFSYAIDGNASVRIAVNGANVNPQLSLPNTGGWTVAADSIFYEVNLTQANNTIRLSGAGVNIVSMSIYSEIE